MREMPLQSAFDLGHGALESARLAISLRRGRDGDVSGMRQAGDSDAAPRAVSGPSPAPRSLTGACAAD